MLNRLLSFLLLFSAGMNLPVFHEGKVLRNQMGAPPQGQERWGQQEKVVPDAAPGLGTQEIPRADGGKDKIYYSITTPEEEKKAQQEEKDKVDKSLDMLKNIIIDRRSQ